MSSPKSERSERRKRSWSFGKPKDKEDEAKTQRKLKQEHGFKTMLDPTRAITEAEPFQVNQVAGKESLRSYQYKDQYGNPITDPDWSNPTRPRWERPLDTIRSFEAAINGEYGKKSRTYVVDTVDTMDKTWRQSQNPEGAPYESSLYNRTNGTQVSGESDAAFGNMTGKAPAFNDHVPLQGPQYPYGHNSGSGSGSTPPRRQHADPAYSSSTEGFHQNRVNVDSGSSGPGSDFNSESAYQDRPTNGQQYRQGMVESPQSVYPPTPLYPHSNTPQSIVTRQPIVLSAPPTPPAPAAKPPPEKEKRKSWFGRRKSKN